VIFCTLDRGVSYHAHHFAVPFHNLFIKFKNHLLLARLMKWASIVLLAGVCCLSSSSVGICNAAGGRVGRPTPQGGPVRLRPITATPCFLYDSICQSVVATILFRTLEVSLPIYSSFISHTATTQVVLKLELLFNHSFDTRSVSEPALCLRLSHCPVRSIVRSFVRPVRYCYHDISLAA